MYIYFTANISWQIYGDTVYVIDERNECVRLIKDAGYYLWIILQENHNYEEIVSKLCELYMIPKDEIIPDFNNYVAELKQLGIVEVLNYDRR